MTIDNFITLIPKIKSCALGGIEAQFQLAPQYRKPYLLQEVKKLNPKPAAVLIILYPDNDRQIRFILTQRPNYQGFHANQISFTGGKHQISDENLLQTAIRETHEEIDVLVKPENIIKSLTEVYIPPSNFLVQPFLSWLEYQPIIRPNYEVHSVLTPTIEHIIHPKIISRNITTSERKTFETKGLLLENEFVWGATAMIISELKQLLHSAIDNVN